MYLNEFQLKDSVQFIVTYFNYFDMQIIPHLHNGRPYKVTDFFYVPIILRTLAYFLAQLDF